MRTARSVAQRINFGRFDRNRLVKTLVREYVNFLRRQEDTFSMRWEGRREGGTIPNILQRIVLSPFFRAGLMNLMNDEITTTEKKYSGKEALLVSPRVSYFFHWSTRSIPPGKSKSRQSGRGRE